MDRAHGDREQEAPSDPRPEPHPTDPGGSRSWEDEGIASTARTDLAAASRAFPWILGVGAIVGLVSLLEMPTQWGAPVWWTVEVLLLVWAIVSWRIRFQYSDRSLAAVLAGAAVIVAAGTYAEHDPTTASVLAFTWVALAAFLFLALRWAIVVGVLTAACVGAMFVAVGGGSDSLYRWIMVVGTMAVSGVAVAIGKHRISILIGRLARAADTDWLTGLNNRRAFDARLFAEMKRARRHGEPLSLLLLDIDHFKNVNDLYGHDIGDEVLKEVATLLDGGRRGHDITGRLGGEEFAVVLPVSDLEGARTVAERTRERIERNFAGRQPSVTISIGVAQMRESTATTEDLLRDADRALYSAKAFGRNQVVLFNSETALRMVESIRSQAPSDGPEVDLMLALLDTLTSLGHHSGGRADRVGRWCLELALALGMHADEAQQVRLAGIFGDVGKLVLPRDILMSKRRLTAEELEQVRRQSEVSADLVSAIGFEGIASWIRHQYERWDGSGHPDGLAGGDIPLPSRIIAVIAAFEAMVTDRPYSPALTQERALLELGAAAGTQFDPDVVEEFVEVLVAERALNRAGDSLPHAG